MTVVDFQPAYLGNLEPRPDKPMVDVNSDMEETEVRKALLGAWVESVVPPDVFAITKEDFTEHAGHATPAEMQDMRIELLLLQVGHLGIAS